MSRIIAAINMTLDGVCDHTTIVPDEAIHHHYANLLGGAGAILYGRITYQLMEYWKTVVEHPTGNQAMDDFAVIMDKTPKIVFSRTLPQVTWDSATLADGGIETVVSELKQQPGKDIFVGSRSLILQLMKLHLLDEFQLCVHPVVAGGGLPLFENVHDRSEFKLSGTKVFGSGAIVLYYEPAGR